MSHAAFVRLCAAAAPPPASPPLAAHPPSFAPFAPDDAPLAGRLFGLDAEFVALAPALRERRGGADVEVRPARLGLARVSVVRGDGPRSGTPAIDDYVRQTEPVHDFLTRWSGLTAADLDPRATRRPLTTAKRAVTKLAHLVAAGAVFVGHGLAQDFRMINIVVPPAQVVDTVDLFRKPGARKLSLRYLAARLLGSDIQVDVHDSVEDARAALALYEKYREVKTAGELAATLDGLYEYGAAHGFGVGGDRGGAQSGGVEFGVGAAAHTV
jgi:PAB-dependent poly(A)-specific ribonuclease subunit 2